MDDERRAGAEPLSFESVTGGSIIDDLQQVRGRVFATDREVLIERFGEARWQAMMDMLPLRTGALFEGLDPDAWYPENELRRCMKGVHAELAEGHSEAFITLARELAAARYARSFRLLRHLASARFAVRKMPVFWRRQRRGPAEVATEFLADDRVLVVFDNFRYCRELLYRQLLMADCQALVLTVGKRVPEVDVVNWDRYSLTLAIHLR